jgi:4-hydroxy-tetrahydrodipicolinate synthase
MGRAQRSALLATPPQADDQIVSYSDQAVAAIGTDIAFVIQDYPLTLSVVMTPGVIARIVTAHESCVMLKHEDWPGLEKISSLRTMQKNDTLRPLSSIHPVNAAASGLPDPRVQPDCFD